MSAFNEPIGRDWDDPPAGTACKLGPCCRPDQQVAVFPAHGGGVAAPHDGHQVRNCCLHILWV